MGESIGNLSRDRDESLAIDDDFACDVNTLEDLYDADYGVEATRDQDSLFQGFIFFDGIHNISKKHLVVSVSFLIRNSRQTQR